jgi:hypothetical protein
MHTGLLQGINNRIKVIKRIAYGFRDHACIFLEIRAAFPRAWVKNQKRAPRLRGSLFKTAAAISAPSAAG